MPRSAKEESELLSGTPAVPALEFTEEQAVPPPSYPPPQSPDEHYYWQLDSDYAREQLDNQCELLGGLTRDQVIVTILNTFLDNKTSRDELQRSYALTEPLAPPSSPAVNSNRHVTVGAFTHSICPVCAQPFQVKQKGQKVCSNPLCAPAYAGFQTDAERNGRVSIASAPAHDPRFSQLESELAELKQMLRQQLRRAA